MKKILNTTSLILGFILFLGGLLLYAINKYGYGCDKIGLNQKTLI